MISARVDALSPRRRMLLAALAGASLTLAQAPLSLWPALFPGWSALMLLARGAARPGWVGFAGGCGYFSTSLFWIGEAFVIEAARQWWLLPLMPLCIAALAAGLALFWAGGFWAAGRLERWMAAPFALAAAMMVAELLRGSVLTGFPWGLQSYAWIGTPVAQMLALAGAYALNGLTILVAALPGLLRPAPALAAAALAAAGWVWGADRLADPAPAQGPLIRLVQPNIAQADKWRRPRGEIFEALLALSGGESAAALTIWPEVAVTFLMDENPEAQRRALDAAGGPVAIGMVRDAGGYYNSLIGYSAPGARFMRYDKRHLTPFGEYTPYLSALGLGTLGEGLSGFRPGETAGPFAPPGAPPAAPLICYEAVFPVEARVAAQGAEWLIHVTNDSWFGAGAGPWQHLAQVRARAIELGLPVARAANTGVSAMIDAKGRLRESLALNRAGALEAALPAALPPTLYRRLGDAPIFAFCTITIIAAGIVTRRLAR